MSASAAPHGAGPRSFRAGLRQRNPLVLVAAALLLVPALLGFNYLFTSGGWTVVPLEYWIRNTGDGLMFVSWSAADLKREPPAAPAVVLTGGSGGREAIWTGEALGADVEAAGGPAVTGVNLSCPSQSFGETLAIVDTVPRGSTVLVGVSIGRYMGTSDASLQQVVGRRLLLESDTLRSFAVERYGAYRYSPFILPGVFESLATWLNKRLGYWSEGRFKLVKYVPHTYDLREARKPETEAHKAQVRASMRTRPNAWQSSVEKNLPFNSALLDEIVRRGHQRGVSIVLVELPHNPLASGAAFEEAFAACQDTSGAIATKYGVPYVDFNEQLGLTGNDFYDFSHVRPRGRTLWQKRLAEELVRLYEAGTIEGGAGTSQEQKEQSAQ